MPQSSMYRRSIPPCAFATTATARSAIIITSFIASSSSAGRLRPVLYPLVIRFRPGRAWRGRGKGPMNIAVRDASQDTMRTRTSFPKVAGHNGTIWKDHTKDVDELARRLKDTEAVALIRERTPITAPLLERLPNLRLIAQVGVAPHIDLEACTRHGVIVSSSSLPGRPSYATAELNWGLIIAAFRRIPQEVAALKAGKWQAYPIGIGLRGKTLGIFGYGKIGAVVAGYGKAFGMNVLAWGRENSVTQARADGVTVAASKDALFAESDVVALHLRLIDATRGIVTAADLGRMKPTALIV